MLFIAILNKPKKNSGRKNYELRIQGLTLFL